MVRKRRRDYWAADSWFFAPSVPRETKGGIKAHSKRGAFGESWWARRWVAAIETLDAGSRLGRGRRYARRGQVTEIHIREGLVAARVQGSRAEPYTVRLRVAPLGRAQWKRVASKLGAEALYAAKLLAGEMPPDIEAVFEAAGASLFPSRRQGLTTDCSCPDWANPCKHIAAVIFLVGEELDRDPFLLFRLRGLSRERLVELMGVHPAESEPTAEPAAAAPPPPEPLPPTPAAFWADADSPVDLPGAEGAGGPVAALPRRLGSFPFWRGEEGFHEALERLYGQAAAAGLEVVAGRPSEPSPD